MNDTTNKSQDLSGQIINYLKSEFVWFADRWQLSEIEHKKVLGKMLEDQPDIGYHLAVIFRRNENAKVWTVSSQELDLLTMLALPYDDDEYVLSDDTGILGIDGKKILRGQ